MGYAPTGAWYEFNEGENFTIGETARYARLWGIISLVAGVLLLMMGIFAAVAFAALVPATATGSSSALVKPAMVVAIGVSLIPSALVSILGGVFYMNASSSLRLVVETQGNDIPLLMQAIQSLSRAFMIEAIAMVFSFVVSFSINIASSMGGHS
jgi:hypothetical protein